MPKPLNILVINYDWRNLFESNLPELIAKFERDRLAPRLNRFFLASWSSRAYYKRCDNLETRHFKARFPRLKFLYDLLSPLFTVSAVARSKFKPDAVLVYDFPLTFSGLLPKLFWRSKIVMALTNLPLQLAETRKLAALKKFYYAVATRLSKRFVDFFMVISGPTEEYLVSAGVTPGKIRRIVPDVISRDQEFIRSAVRGAVRRKYGLAGKKIILAVGRFEKEKGFADLIGWFKKINLEDTVLMLAGDGQLAGDLKRLTREADLEERVIFAGTVTRKEIWNYYTDADAFILLSHTEGLGLVFWEAMFMGVPVIGRRTGGIIETIGAREERGYLWDPSEDVQGLRQKIERCLDKDAETEEKIRQAKRYVETKIKESGTVNINQILESL